MGNSQDKGRNIIVQGSILAIAQIVVRLIGLVYRIPLQRIAGDVAMGYYGYAFDIYMMLLLISSNGVPLAVSKMISAVRVDKNYVNEHRIMLVSVVFTFIIGGALGGLTFIFANQIVTAMFGADMLGVVPALRVLAPTVFLCCVMSSFRGYFQGIENMIPTAISQIIEQIFNAVVSIVAAYMLVRYGAPYAAMGGTLGTCIGALSSVVFLVIIYLLYRPTLVRRANRDKTHQADSYKKIATMMAVLMGPVIVSSIIYQISGIVDSSLYSHILSNHGYAPELVSTLYGIYTTKYKTLVNVPLALATALGLAVVPGVTEAWKRDNLPVVREKITTTVKFCMVIAIPACVGLSVLAAPIMQLLYNDTTSLASRLLMIGTPYVFFYSLSTVTVGALQGIDKMRVPVINAGISLAVHVVFIVILLQFCDMNIYAILYSNILFGFMMCIFNQIALRKAIDYHQEMIQTFLIPGVSSAVMGVVTFFVYRGVYLLLHINLAAIILSIAASMAVYALLLVRLKGITEEEIYQFPKGTTLVHLFKKMHIL